MGTQLSEDQKIELVKLLQENIDTFVEHSNSVKRVSTCGIIEHQLEVNPKANPIQRLLKVEFIREIKYPS